METIDPAENAGITHRELTAMLKREYDRGFREGKASIRANGTKIVLPDDSKIPRLTPEQVRLAQALFAKGHNQKDVFQALGFYQGAVWYKKIAELSGFRIVRKIYSCLPSGRQTGDKFTIEELGEIQTLLDDETITNDDIALRYGGGKFYTLLIKLRRTGHAFGYALEKKD